MTKKRQQDFQKTKLKPGKKLPRGRNITNTTFKAKKIVMPVQKRKEKCDYTIPECIKNARHAGPINSRVNSLNQLNNLIKKEENLSIFLPDIFDNVTKLILDSEELIRNAALKVIFAVLENTETSKIVSFIPILNNVLSCCMSHTDLRIKAISLRFLDILLKTHSDLLCNSFSLLQNAKDLLSGPSCYAKTRKGQQKTNLMISSGDSFFSQDWKIQVLSRMSTFLQVMLENMKSDEEKDEKSDEIYWDAKKPLYVEIFTDGGLKPADIEKEGSSLFGNNDFEATEDVWTFIADLMVELSQILIEELTDGKVKDDYLVLEETINHLGVLFDVVSHLADWVQLICEKNPNIETKLMEKFSMCLKDQIFHFVKFPFIPRGPEYDAKPQSPYQNLPCVRLNLSICYLYCAFLLKPEDSEDYFTEQVKSYLKRVLMMSYEIKFECIPTILKIMKCFLTLNKESDVIPEDYLHGLLVDLIKVVKIEDDRENRQMLINFFNSLCLSYGNDFFVYSEMLKIWFPQIIGLLHKWVSTWRPVSKRTLKDIQKIALRKHEHFLNALDKLNSESFQALLTHKNEDISETAMFLLYNKKTVSEDLLYDIGHLILSNPKFKEKRALKLIRLLTSRFAEPTVSSEDRTNFIMFLLNLALDAGNLDERWSDYDLPEFDREWGPISNSLTYSILPNTEWKTHSDLFETCKKCLNAFSSEIVSRICMRLIHEITEAKKTLPLHFVLATLKLDECLPMPRHFFQRIIGDLEYSTMFFLSVVTYVEVDDDWYQGMVIPIMKTIRKDRKSLHEFLDNHEYDYGLKTLKKCYHTLRIIKCYVSNCSIFQEDAEKIFQVLDFLKETCEESDISKQPLFESVYKFIHSSFYTY